jgi:acetyl esterase/lipase
MVSHSNAGLRLFAVDYRLSPANPFPSALIDALSAYRYLVQNEKISPDTIFFGGDSAGGNLATSTAIYLRDCPALGFGTPKGLVLISPWIDLHRSSPTLSLNDEFTACLLEFIKVGETLEEPPALPYIKHAIGMKHTDPLVSPIYDDGKLPAMMIAVGTVDRFLGECLAQGIKQVGKGDVVVMGEQTQSIFQTLTDKRHSGSDYVEDQVHVFQMFGWLPQTCTYFARANAFIKDLSSGAISTSVSYISADGRVKDLAKGAEDSVKEQKKRLRGYLERQQKDGLDKGAWKRTAFYRSLAE